MKLSDIMSLHPLCTIHYIVITTNMTIIHTISPYLFAQKIAFSRKPRLPTTALVFNKGWCLYLNVDGMIWNVYNHHLIVHYFTIMSIILNQLNHDYEPLLMVVSIVKGVPLKVDLVFETWEILVKWMRTRGTPILREIYM